MPIDVTVRYKNIADESLVQFDGTVKKFKRYDFFIGTFGPFTERVPLDEFTEQAITLKVQQLVAHVRTLTT